MLDKLAGINYRDENSAVIQHLISVGKPALVGIQQEDGIYTVLGHEKVYYATPSGVEEEIAIGDFLPILTRNGMSNGKAATYEFIQINEKDSVWVMNTHVMNALWNTMHLLHKE
jgi:hypothetical protein